MEIREEVINVEAESLDSFLKKETAHRIELIEKDYAPGGKRQIPAITGRQLAPAFVIMIIGIIVHIVVQFTVY